MDIFADPLGGHFRWTSTRVVFRVVGAEREESTRTTSMIGRTGPLHWGLSVDCTSGQPTGPGVERAAGRSPIPRGSTLHPRRLQMRS